PNSYYAGLDPYLRSTGLTYEVSPIISADRQTGVNTDKMYRNVTERFRWGGLDVPDNDLYLDETVRRMVVTHRSALLDLALELYNEGIQARRIASMGQLSSVTPDSTGMAEYATDRFNKALNVLKIIDEKLPAKAAPHGVQLGEKYAQIYNLVGEALNNDEALARSNSILRDEIDRYTQYILYFQSLKPWQYASLPTNDQYIYMLKYSNNDYDSYYEGLIHRYINQATDAESREMLNDIVQRGVDVTKFPLLSRLFKDSGSDDDDSFTEVAEAV
ncbi:MAG: hypothetical protein K2M76_06795, partial [Muribaculaceae bacterium]|nr:hypothetical protein [Muribaculaceae bacterium]